MDVLEINGLRAMALPVDGPLLSTEQDAVDVIGSTYGQDIDLVVVPVSRLAPDFFVLSTRLAGGFIQKFTNYHCRVAFLGDISGVVAASGALRDFVRESNARGTVVFAADRVELAALVR